MGKTREKMTIRQGFQKRIIPFIQRSQITVLRLPRLLFVAESPSIYKVNGAHQKIEGITVPDDFDFSFVFRRITHLQPKPYPHRESFSSALVDKICILTQRAGIGEFSRIPVTLIRIKVRHLPVQTLTFSENMGMFQKPDFINSP